MNCPNCNHEVNNNDSVCPVCGYSSDSENRHHNISPIPAWLIGIIAFVFIVVIAIAGYFLIKPDLTAQPDQNNTASESFSTEPVTTTETANTENLSDDTVYRTSFTETSTETETVPLPTSISTAEIDSTVSSDAIYAAYTKVITDNSFPYALADIDKNGVCELILKESWDEGQRRIYHIYTYKDNDVESLGQFYYDFPMYIVKIADKFYFAEDGLHTYVSEIRLVENEIYVGENRVCTEKTSDLLFSDSTDFSDLETLLGISKPPAITTETQVIQPTETSIAEFENTTKDESVTYAEAYLPLIQQAFMVDEYAKYCIYDLNADGTNEIIIGTNLGGAMGLHQFFTLENGMATHCGEISGSGYLLEESGNLYYETASWGYQEINQVQTFGNSIYMTLYFSSDEMMTEYLDFGTDLTYYYTTDIDPVYALDS